VHFLLTLNISRKVLVMLAICTAIMTLACASVLDNKPSVCPRFMLLLMEKTIPKCGGRRDDIFITQIFGQVPKLQMVSTNCKYTFVVPILRRLQSFYSL
jgi:hypothetical protein